MPWGLLFVLIFVSMTWNELDTSQKTIGQIIAAAMELPAWKVSEMFGETMLIVGIGFAIVALAGKGWVTSKVGHVIRELSLIENHAQDLLKLAKERVQRRS